MFFDYQIKFLKETENSDTCVVEVSRRFLWGKLQERFRFENPFLYERT